MKRCSLNPTTVHPLWDLYPLWIKAYIPDLFILWFFSNARNSPSKIKWVFPIGSLSIHFFNLVFGSVQFLCLLYFPLATLQIMEWERLFSLQNLLRFATSTILFVWWFSVNHLICRKAKLFVLCFLKIFFGASYITLYKWLILVCLKSCKYLLNRHIIYIILSQV